MTPDVEVMTVAKWTAQYCDAARNAPWYLGTLAALEEREALLGRVAVLTDERERARTEAAEVRRLGESDASVGALVRRIGELQPSAYLTWAGHPMCYYVKHPSVLQSALDSLLPKEPEVHDAPSKRQYRRKDDGKVETRYRSDIERGGWSGWHDLGGTILSMDAPVVAKLMAKGGKDGE